MHCEQLIENHSDPISNWIVHVIVQNCAFEGHQHSPGKDGARRRVSVCLRNFRAVDQERCSLAQNRADLDIIRQLRLESVETGGHPHQAS